MSQSNNKSISSEKSVTLFQNTNMDIYHVNTIKLTKLLQKNSIDDCPVCYNPLTMQNAILLNCHHIFCRDCIIHLYDSFVKCPLYRQHSIPLKTNNTPTILPKSTRSSKLDSTFIILQATNLDIFGINNGNYSLSYSV